MALDFARTAKFRDVVDLILRQQRFIASMQGRDAASSTFSVEQFDEAAFEAQLTAARTPTVICLYWIFELKGRFLSGDYAEAQAAADKAKALLSTSAVQFQLLDYLYYAALTVAAVFETSLSCPAIRVAGTPDLALRTIARVGREQSTDFLRQTRPGVGRDRAPR